MIGPVTARVARKTRSNPTNLLDANWRSMQQFIQPTHRRKRKQLVATENRFPKKLADKNDTLSKIVALDCEMVGVGPLGSESRLARICVINLEGEVIFESYCKPKEKITDYRTLYSGIREADLVDAPELGGVRDAVLNMIKNKVVVGHNVSHDFEVLLVRNHPRKDIRDTSNYHRFKSAGRKQKLKILALKELNWSIQDGEHDPYIDARAALELYKKYADEWESRLQSRKANRKLAKKEGKSANRKVKARPPKNETQTTDIFARKIQSEFSSGL